MNLKKRLEWEVWDNGGGVCVVDDDDDLLSCAGADADASFKSSNSISICSDKSSLSSAPILSVLNSMTAMIKLRITSILRRVFKYVSISWLAV